MNGSVRNKALVICAVTLAVFLILLTARPVLRILDDKTADMGVRILERCGWGKRSTGNVVVVALDQASALAKKPLIFWYPEIGRFLRLMREVSPKAVGIDLIPVHSLGEKLKEALASLPDLPRNGISPALLDRIGDAADRSLLAPLIELSESVPVIVTAYNGNVPFFYGELPFFKNIVAASASITVDAGDGVLRSQASVVGGQPSFSAALFAAATGRPPATHSARTDYTRWKSIPVIPFDAVMNGAVDKAALRGKIVVLGFLSSDDRHPTPVSPALYGSVLHAVVLDSLLAGSDLKAVSAFTRACVLFVFALAGAVAGFIFRPVTACGGAACAALAYCMAVLAAMSSGSVMSTFPQVLAPFLALGFVYPYRYVFEERDRKKMYKVFNYFLDKKVIDELVAGSLDSLLRGERKVVTVMFIDVRNFTAMSQAVEPEVLLAVLNHFFEGVTRIVLAHNGVVNKFIGDGIMAFFPLRESSRVDAVRASLEICGLVGDMAAGVAARLPEGMRFAAGIGLNHGEVIVGNVGSELKMDFTVMGPTVNLASRIEGLTKQFGVGILMSESVRQGVAAEFHCPFAGEGAVKGVAGPVRVFTVSGKGYRNET